MRYIESNSVNCHSLYELTPMNNPTSFQKQISSKESHQVLDTKQGKIAQDIFDYGFMLLICAVGGLELFESSDFTEKLKIFLEEFNKKPQDRHKYCCLIHNEDLISSIKLASPESTLFTNKPVKVHKANNGFIVDKNSKNIAEIRIQDFLKSANFSRDFIDFLCSCLKFDPERRATSKDLFNSHFFRRKDNNGPNVSLLELLKISSQWSRNFVLPPEYHGPSEAQLQKLYEALNVVLPNCERFVDEERRDFSELDNFDENNAEIKELANDMGIPVEMVWKKLQPLFISLREQTI
jgi:serine/threonine protein kinase